MKHLFAAVAAVAASPAFAGITPLSGTQTSSGATFAHATSQPDVTQSYSLSAPSATASWSPAAQNIQAVAYGVGAHLQSSYQSPIGSGGVTLSTSEAASLNSGTLTSTSPEFNFALTFSLRFTIDAPGNYEVSGSLVRTQQVWPFTASSLLSFGVEGQPALVSLENTGPAFPNTVSYPLTTLSLAAGTYVIQASDGSSWSNRAGAWNSSINFSLNAVPAPSGLAALLLGAAVAPTRRRACPRPARA